MSFKKDMENKKIEIRQLSIGYKGKRSSKIIAQDFNSVLFSGELTCLIGVNGIGKSTLLRTLSGFQPPLSGDILIDDKKISSFSNKELSKTIGVVLTEKVEVRDLSVTELVSMGRSPYTGFWGKLNPEDKTIVNEAIHQVKISDLAKRSMETLSDGERQKVMIAKVLAQQTPVIFLDEPTAFLDFPSKVEIMQLLRRLSRKNDKVLFFSTHDLELALQIADKLWIMDREKGLTVGAPHELAETGCLSTLFRCEDIVFDRQTCSFRIR
jgi:iron complex transport system ATP-binding protein